MNYADKLRELAGWLDAHPKWANNLSHEYPRISVYLGDEGGKLFAELIRDMGTADKHGYGGTLSAYHWENRKRVDGSEETIYALGVHLSGVCEKVPKVDDDGNPIMVPKKVTTTTDEMEPEYEWRCPESFLALGQ